MLVENMGKIGEHMDNMLVWTTGPHPRFYRRVSHGTSSEDNQVASPEEFPRKLLVSRKGHCRRHCWLQSSFCVWAVFLDVETATS